MNKTITGFHAGFIATGPMTVLMMAAQDILPKPEKSPLPPATLSEETFERLGIEFSTPEAKSLVTLVSHFGYGGAMGAIYSHLQTPSRVKQNAILKGIVFGLGVWAGSYWVMSPLLKFRASGPKMPLKRNLMMAGAHVLWGASLGYSEQRLRRHGEEMLDGDRKAIAAE